MCVNRLGQPRLVADDNDDEIGFQRREYRMISFRGIRKSGDAAIAFASSLWAVDIQQERACKATDS